MPNSGNNSNSIWIAIIGAAASLGVAYLTADKTAEQTAEKTAETTISNTVDEKVNQSKDSIIEQAKTLAVVTGGNVDQDGRIQSTFGLPFTVEIIQSGQYKIKFSKPFKQAPIVVATGEGLNATFVEITFIGPNEFEIQSRNHKHLLKPTGFQFLVVRPE